MTITIIGNPVSKRYSVVFETAETFLVKLGLPYGTVK
jgi:hypothetical protein